MQSVDEVTHRHRPVPVAPEVVEESSPTGISDERETRIETVITHAVRFHSEIHYSETFSRSQEFRFPEL